MLPFILLPPLPRVTFQSSHNAVGRRWLITTPTVPQTAGRELKFQFSISPQKVTGFYFRHHLVLGEGGALCLWDLLRCPTPPHTWRSLDSSPELHCGSSHGRRTTRCGRAWLQETSKLQLASQLPFYPRCHNSPQIKRRNQPPLFERVKSRLTPGKAQALSRGNSHEEVLAPGFPTPTWGYLVTASREEIR